MRWHEVLGALGVILLIAVFARCAVFQKVASECGPELIADVGEMIVRDDWRDRLRSKTIEVGVSALSCALRAILSPTTSAPSRSLSRSSQTARTRARLWLDETRK